MDYSSLDSSLTISASSGGQNGSQPWLSSLQTEPDDSPLTPWASGHIGGHQMIWKMDNLLSFSSPMMGLNAEVNSDGKWLILGSPELASYLKLDVHLP
jgi:hypothetical protein